ncbi:S9 family peptidase [Maribellus maritimus]|uniref:S9 family peptidase n=1 Tax=Maribellus maritimus TaxID=2870838 RepID=UPI001EEAD3FF|nr:prolyl oligopeptidase family serine peptidase [Maribellus maritimus]MCG6188469.1 prolyl oligopeptidase family serine peptidase [Maribellus maritimus]
MKKTAALFIFLMYSLSLFAQGEKKALTHDDILKWERITEQHISNDGKYVVYKQEPWKGDPTLKITTPEGDEKASIECATNAQITSDSKFVVFTLKPAEDTIRTLKLKKTKKEDFPKDDLLIYNLKNNQIDTVKNYESVKVPEKWAGWIAWQTETPKDTTKKEKGPKGKKDEKVFPLFIKNLISSEVSEFPAVSDYVFAEEKEMLTFISEGKDSTFDAGIYCVDLKTNLPQKVWSGEGKFKQLTISKTGDKIAFLGDSSEDKKDEANYNLYLWNGEETASVVLTNENDAVPESWEISEDGGLSFSDSGERLFYGTAPKKAPKDTTVLEEEIPVLDIWTWNEEELQTVQLHNRNRDMKKTYLSVFNIPKEKAVQLETKAFSGIQQTQSGDGDKFIAWSNHPYAVQSMWEGSPDHNDFYLVDVNTGDAKKIDTNVRANPRFSPEGKYVYWYNAVDTSWNTLNIKSEKEFKITSPITVQVADELNDVPNLPRSYGNAGWLKDDEAILINDRFDVWKVDPENKTAPVKITKNGRENNIEYRVIDFENQGRSRFGGGEEQGIDPKKPMYLSGHNEVTREDGYYVLTLKKGEPQKLISGKYSLNRPHKAKDADQVVFTKENFETYPNLIATDLSFKEIKHISVAAPQQKDFLWGTAELVSWTSLDGRKMEGTLHKPENFDPSKKYPMIVNFYEKSSQELYSYRMPENHRSTIDYHYYTSNGYLVFNPDVYYKTGYPGEDAFNCVMPGVTSLIEKGFVDEKHIGAQGHSWGGYQVAYLATRTNLFAAIESGAPVVNMFSAYGGIRWGSGLNRSFQYEHTQSRIGKSIWDAPLRYLENSPLFTIDKINTPILIMHNDDDGAVPWYQGIEFFIGLRRLQKPAWLLNYNEADHWPLKVRDKTDFQIRLAQFFDHYLKGEPMPQWMKEGIPAVDKGTDLGYELSE